MRLATWNVNSLKVRLPQTLDWLAQYQPDVLCLQETKSQDENFPSAAIAAAGYHPLYTGQKTYNGVALLSKQQTPGDVLTAIPDFDDPQKRVLAATYTKAGEGEIRVICVYVPNGDNIESDKYQYKLKWLRALRAWLQQELRRYPRLAVLGDFNIAPTTATSTTRNCGRGRCCAASRSARRCARCWRSGCTTASVCSTSPTNPTPGGITA